MRDADLLQYAHCHSGYAVQDLIRLYLMEQFAASMLLKVLYDGWLLQQLLANNE